MGKQEPLFQIAPHTLVFQEGMKTENNEHINLKVAGQDGSVVQFKIKRHTPLSKLMKAYCERQVSPYSRCNVLALGGKHSESKAHKLDVQFDKLHLINFCQ